MTKKQSQKNTSESKRLKTVKITSDCNDIVDECPLELLETRLRDTYDIDPKIYTDVKLEFEWDNYDESYRLAIYGRRLETDQEVNERIKRAEKAAELKIKRAAKAAELKIKKREEKREKDLKELARLKKLYEP